eukprot:TRINITY_DN59328_c0_g1_i1.p1 TRINITY_DN59328_c0_g1~~TRINITY_DN59328_c0_g1_i1.p1  ORF type:complete len:773 (-),score=169.88 TRINITY_DN59328_c0_g1_i1:280-2598(-)
MSLRRAPRWNGLLRMVGLVGSVALAQEEPTSTCWSGAFTFARCCLGLMLTGDEGCFTEEYNYELCCQAHPLLSAADVSHIAAQSAVAARIGKGTPAAEYSSVFSCLEDDGSVTDWPGLRQVLMTKPWAEVKSFYRSWVINAETSNQATCPLGLISLLLCLVHLKNLGDGGTKWLQTPAMLWAEEALAIFARRTGAIFWRLAASAGWMLPHLLGHMQSMTWPKPHPLRDHRCGGGQQKQKQGAADAKALMEGGWPYEDAAVPRAVARLLRADREQEQLPCPLDAAMRYWAIAEGLARGPSSEEATALLEAVLEEGSSLLHEEVLQAERPLLLLGANEPGGLKALEKAMHTLPLPLSLTAVLGYGAGARQTRLIATTLRPPFDAALQHASTSFSMRLFSVHEVISDHVRSSLVPFCGMLPFIKLVEDVAHNAATSGCPADDEDHCRLTVLEGGANVGSCLLWAAAALQAAGSFLLSIAVEPMREAARLFTTSVQDNGFTENIFVEEKALVGPGEQEAKLRYALGRHGQASLDRHSHSGCGVGAMRHADESCVEEPVRATTIDHSWGRRFGSSHTLDILKLNVNGEEVNALRGARALLSKRRVCMVMMHVFKLRYAVAADLEIMGSSAAEPVGDISRRGGATTTTTSRNSPAAQAAASRVAALSSEMFELLTKEAGMDLLLYLDPPTLRFEKNEAISVKLQTAGQLNEVLTTSDTEHGRMAARWSNKTEQALPSFALEDTTFHQTHLIARQPVSAPETALPCSRPWLYRWLPSDD